MLQLINCTETVGGQSYPVYTIEQTSSKHQADLMESRPLAKM